MEVCTAGAHAAPAGHADRVLVVLRRIGVVVGVLFGLGLLAVVMAEHAAAEEQAAPRQEDGAGGLGGLVEPLTRPLAEVTGAVVRPVVDTVITPVVDGVVAPVVEPLAPVLKPVVDPLTRIVQPVVEPLAPPAPVVETVVPSAEPDSRPVPVIEPALVPVPAPVALATEQVPAWSAVVVPVVGDVDHRSVAERVPSSTVHLGQGGDGPRPAVPSTAVPLGVTGGGSVGGAGGTHGADALASGSDGVLAEQDTQERGPPGTIVGSAWHGYDDRDHPS